MAKKLVTKPKEAKQIPDVEMVATASLKAHPRNYRKHGEDQLAHIVQSIRANGCYRNIVIACDNTILAGHGVVEGCTIVGIREVPCVRMPWGPDDPRSLRIMTGDNEIARLGVVDDRMLSDMLKDINDKTQDLIGTGFDAMQLANLVMVTRTEDEIPDGKAAAAWVGMPEFQAGEETWRVVVHCTSQEDRAKFLKKIGAKVVNKTVGKTASIYWPEKPRQDLKSVRFSGKK